MNPLVIIGIINAVCGAVLAIACRPLGAFQARIGSSMFPGSTFYVKKKMTIFNLVVGVWLIGWGGLLVFLLPNILTGTS